MKNRACPLFAVWGVCLTCLLTLFSGCTSIPKGASAVTGLDKSRYLGKWYEIARFDFTFERNLNNTTAEYSVRDDGFISVLNKGYNYRKNRWEEARGKARFTGSDTVGQLVVSFFGPFYSPYNIISLDGDYQYALIAGKNTSYLWILSRETTIPDDIKAKYLAAAKSLGCDTEKLIWVEHDR